MSSLLEEAIVDAKALKDAALKNAENTVLEKYSSEVKNALSTLLEQDEFGLEEGDEGGDASFTDDLPFAFQTEELDAPPADELIEIDFDSLKARIEEEEAAGFDAGAESLTSAPDLAADLSPAPEMGEPVVDAAADLAEGTGGPPGPESPAGFADISSEDDASMSGPDDPGLMGTEAEEESKKTMTSMTEDDDEDIDLTEEMLSDLIEELVVDMTPRPQGWSSLGSADNSVVQANDEAMGIAQAAHLEEEEEIEEVHTAPDVVSDADLYETKITQLKESTREFRALLMIAKEQLTKLNLANAKLVYQNKALSSASLNERQKHKIVEAVQLANSVEEAQVLFETIQNAVGVSNSDNSLRPQTLREAVQRPVSLLLNSKKNNEATYDPKMDRMLRLAGLTKQ